MSGELVTGPLAGDRSEPRERRHDAHACTAQDREAAHLVENLIRHIGEDPWRAGLLRTPQRVVQGLRYLTKGYEESLDDQVSGAVFTEQYSELVAVTDIEFYSLCEHHLLPFFGRAHVGYIPDGRLIGLSKLPRIVDLFARRLQVQERLTEQVAAALMRALTPLGVAVVVEASHLCMMMRGVQKQISRTVTSSMRGVLLDDPRSRDEFLRLVQARRR